MPRDTTIKAILDIGAKIDSFESAIHKIQNELNKLSLSNIVSSDFDNIFKDLDSQIKNIRNTTRNNQIALIDEKKTTESFNRLASGYKDLLAKLKSNNVNTSFLEKDARVIEALKTQISAYTREVKKSNEAWAQQEKELKANLASARAQRSEANAAFKEAKNSAKQNIDAQKEITRAKETDLKAAEKEAEAIKKSNKEQANFLDTWLKSHKTLQGANSAYQKQSGKLWDSKAAREYKEAVDRVTAAQKEAEAAQQRLNQVSQENDPSTYAELEKNFNSTSQAVRDAEANLRKFQATTVTISPDTFVKIREALLNIPNIDWKDYGVDPATIDSVDALKGAYDSVSKVAGPRAQEILKTINDQLVIAQGNGREAKAGYDETAESLKKMGSTASDIERLTSRLVQFFSIDNAVRLFRRAIHSAAETVKDLDKVMTETAVVTDFSIGDMWKQLPEYTKRANELGLAVRDVYEASTLYYQQGLKTNEVMAVTNATLRMARIASLDAADATDRMTNALRGFNMEINEANADNIADVYSKLAAISASNVDEISTAMTKVASLANSANMQFETTAAFLAQIIETTRESAETAGTALKTVVARFSEVKDLYSKGELLGTDEEGEEIDVNKVSKALRTAGINLNEFLTGQRGLDEIFIELASKWDSLDIVQQRYIATMAAGSRQQSRFIALMSDYKRTQELTSAAENAAGASMEQYNKTLESVQTKLNRLKNAWNEFLMGIANDKAIRFALDTVIDFLKGINKLTDGISGGNGLIKSIASLGITIGGLKVGGSIIKKILGDPSAGIKGRIHEAITGIKSPSQLRTLNSVGQQWGSTLANGVSSTFGNVKHLLARTFKKKVTLEDLGLDKIDVTDTINSHDTGKVAELFNLSNGKTKYLDSLNQRLKDGQISQKAYEAGLKRIGVTSEITSEQSKKLGATIENQQQALNTTRVACVGLGAAFTAVGAIFEKTQGKSSKLAIGFKTVGTTLMGVGAILPILSGAFQAFGISVTKTIMGIPIIGWVAAAITAIISLIAIINQFNVTAEKQAETAKNAFESASTAANDAKTAYDNLNSSLDKLGEQETNIENLSKGTKEWTEAVKEHNQDVMELIGTYKELDIVSKGGVLTVTNAEEVERLYEQKQYEASFIAAGAQLTAQAAVTRATGYRQTQNDESYNEQINLLRAVREGKTSLNIDAIKQYIENEGLTSTWAGNFLSGDAEAQQRQVELLNELNGDYKEFIQLERNYMTTIANAAIRMADLDLSQSKYIDTLEGATDVINDRYQTFSEFTNASGLESALNSLSDDLNKDRIEAQYKQYVSSQTGVNVNQINNDGSFEDANGNTRYFSEFSSGFIGSLLRTDLAKSYQQLATTLTKFENSVDNTENIIAQTFASGGSGLTVASLRQLSSNIFSMNSDQVKELAEKIYNDLGGENALGDREVFKEGFAENILNATGNFNRAGTGFSNLTSGVIKSFNERFEKYIQNTSIFDNIINSKLKGMGITEAGDITKILNILAGTDLSSRRDIESVTGILETMGLDVASEEWDNFIDFIIERTGAVDEIDLTHFKENLDSIKKTISDLRSGEHNNIFTDEEYAAIRPYVNEEDFQETAYGMLYVGDDFESLGDKIQQAIRDGFDETSRILENKINLVDVYEQASSKAVKYASGKAAYDRASARNEYEQLGLSSRGVSFDQFYTSRENEYTARETLKNVLQDYDDNIGDLQIPGLADLVKNGGVENLKLEEVENYLSLIEAEVAKQDENKSQQANLEITKRIEGGLQKLVENWEEGNEADSTAFKYLISDSNLPDFLKQQFLSGFEAAAEESKQDIAWQAVNLSEVYGNAESWEVDLELLSSMAQNYQEIFAAQGEAYETSTAQATRLALANINLNTGLKEIVDSYKSWNEILKQGVEDESIKQTAEYQETIKQLKQSIQQMFGIQGELSNKFIDSAETIELLGQAATGTEEEIQDAINKLRMLAAKDIVASFTLKVGDNDYTELWNTTEQQVQDLLDSIDPSIDIQTQLNPEAQRAVIDSFNELLKAGAITSKQMNDYFSTVGFVPEVEYITSSHWVQHFGKMPTIKYFTNGQPYVDMLDYAWTEKETISVPQIKDLDYSGKAPVINPSIITQAGENAKSSTPKQSSSSKPKQWKNPYDELYNLQEKINSALRERERLEHRYQDMLKDHTKVAQDLTKNSYEEIASLKKQLALQNQMLSGRQKQMKKVLSETYEDSEGNRRTYSSMGVQKYGWYEAATQTVHIEWDKINQVTDENLGGAIEAYISRLEEIRDKIQDTEDAIEDAKDQLLEIAERGKEEYIDFEQQIYDALINQQQKNIETLENINSSIKEAADKTINAIQDEIEKERQARENEKAQEDIYDKEMRLAYLQRDTSGANALEIQKLQEEIQNDQLSYQDKIIDQTIQEMQDEAARAEEQRQAEIDLLNAQLEWDQEHGFYWSQVEALIQSGMNSDGSLKLDSELDQLLKDTEGPLSKFGDIKWKQDLARQIASAMQGRANWEMSAAKEAGEMTLANGTKLSYDAKNDKWYDSKGKEYTNFNWNSEADAFTASKVKTSSTSSTTSTSSSKSASSSDSSVKTYTVRDGDSLWTIAAREYGDGNKAYDIARYNNIGNADMIYTGQVLKLPKKFAKGGLADFTGPAWLDGSKSHPEMVLNAADTQNLITLKNVLAAILQNDGNTAKNNSGNNYFDINIQADIDSDYDVDRLADRIKKQIYDDASYRNVNAISYIR